MAKFEAHVTLRAPVDAKAKKRYGEVAEKFGWKTSWIHKDPVLGDRDFFYLTKYASKPEPLIEEMKDIRSCMRKDVLRRKVEEIVYDKREA